MIYLYIGVMALVTYLIRVIPLTVFRKKDREPVHPFVSVLCAVYLPDCHDVPGDPLCNGERHKRACRRGGGSGLRLSGQESGHGRCSGVSGSICDGTDPFAGAVNIHLRSRFVKDVRSFA